MTIKNTVPNLYACGTMNIQGKMLLVKQVSQKGEPHVKLPGGTYMGPRENWKKKGEEANHYYIDSRKDVQRKILESLHRAYGSYACDEIKNQFPEIVQWAMEFIHTGNEIYDNPTDIQYSKTQDVVEWIEELGIVPVGATFLCSTSHGEHTKYAFEITAAISFSAEQERFIAVETAADIPKRGIDFDCADFEVKETILLSEAEAVTSNFAWGIHTDARNVLLAQWRKDSLASTPEGYRDQNGVPYSMTADQNNQS